MRAKSRRSPFHSHTEGVRINFRNGIFETKKPQEINILKKYDGIYWNIISENLIKKEKPKIDTKLKRNILFHMAKDKGYEGKYFDSTKGGLIKFLEAL